MVMTIFKTLENFEEVLVSVSVLAFQKKNGLGSSLGFRKFGLTSVIFNLGLKNFLKNRVFRFQFRFWFPHFPKTQLNKMQV